MKSKLFRSSKKRVNKIKNRKVISKKTFFIVSKFQLNLIDRHPKYPLFKWRKNNRTKVIIASSLFNELTFKSVFTTIMMNKTIFTLIE